MKGDSTIAPVDDQIRKLVRAEGWWAAMLNRRVWHCPPEIRVKFGLERVSDNHLEVQQIATLQSLSASQRSFDSIHLDRILYRVPGRMEAKAGQLFDELIPLLNSGGVIFGSSILGMEIQRPLLARIIMAICNRRSRFFNAEDSLGGLMEALSHRFRVFEVEVHGCVVLFWGKGIRTSYLESHPSLRPKEEDSDRF